MASLRNLQLNWLRTFEAVGRCLSFSNAAAQLNMSQSAVSQQIMLLEHKLGRQLFTRRQRAIELTLAGRAYLVVVHEALQHIEHGIEGIFNTEAEGVLELAANNSFVQLWLTHRLKRFVELHPRISVRMHGTNWEAEAPPTTAALEIRYGRGIWQDYHATAVLSRRMLPFCSRNTEKAVRAARGLREVILIEVLGVPVGWTEWLAQYASGRGGAYRRIYVDSAAIAAEMAAHDVGVCLLHEELIRGSRLNDQLVSPLKESLNDQACFYLLRPMNRSISGAAKAFMSWIETERTPSPDHGPEPVKVTKSVKSVRRHT